MIDQRPVPRSLRGIDRCARAYSRLFAVSAAAPRLSRPAPVRRTGFDLDLRVVRLTVEADAVVSVTLVSPDGQPLPSWFPGAHLDVHLPSGKVRQYSLCGDPRDRTRYRFAVRRLDGGGGGSVEVHRDVMVGSTLRVRGPRNGFPLIEAPSYLFVAGGIGITPILPMAATAARGKAPWELVYLGRSRATLPFLGELESVAGDALTVRTDDVDGLPDLAELLGRAAPGAAIYVCGPPAVLDAARRLAPEINPTCSLHLERFGAPPVEGGEPFDLELRRTGVTVRVAADETALAAVRRSVPDVAYSCQQGFCGTCKVAVLRGDIEQMLLCVDRSDSDLVVDL